MRAIYSLGILLYSGAIRLASFWNSKATKWISGRKNWEDKLKNAVGSESGWIWFHCASLGEFEQGRPLIESIKNKYPKQKIILTFFSPSGYEIRKDYSFAHHVCYLPSDTQNDARKFLNILKPSAVFFIKYDIWINYLLQIRKRNISSYLVSAKLNADSPFLKSVLSPLYKTAFQSFTWIFCQDEDSGELLKRFTGKSTISVTGDTRFDRVAQIASSAETIPELEPFTRNNFCVIAGSVWPEDEAILFDAMNRLKNENIRWIIAPHEINPHKIQRRVLANFETEIAWSQIHTLKSSHHILWIDIVGMLNRLYRYGNVAFIGGGFGKGIHNTQEAAVFGLPLAFGPVFNNFNEAVEMNKTGIATCVKSGPDLSAFVLSYLNDEVKLKEDGEKARTYILSQTGATEKIMQKVLTEWSIKKG